MELNRSFLSLLSVVLYMEARIAVHLVEIHESGQIDSTSQKPNCLHTLLPFFQSPPT